MRWGTAVFSCALALSAGCVQSNNRPAKFVGDAHGRACMEALPSLDVADSELSEQMRMARLLSAESLELPSPAVPADKSAVSLTRWSEHELKDWVGAKQKRAEQARAELDRAALENHRQRIVAGALVGLVFEDVARALLVLPIPSELEREPEVATIFHELMVKQAEPYLMHARLAYAACAGNAAGLATMSHWSDFCSGRQDSLPKGNEEPQTEVALVGR
jgi:sulfur carrier protein ThiS